MLLFLQFCLFFDFFFFFLLQGGKKCASVNMSFLNGDGYNRLETVLFVKSFYLVQNFFLFSGFGMSLPCFSENPKKKKKMNKVPLQNYIFSLSSSLIIKLQLISF